MRQTSPLPGPGRDEHPLRVPPWPEWMDDPAYLAVRTEAGDPSDLAEDEDPDNAPPAGPDDAELDALITEAGENGPAAEAGPGRTGSGRRWPQW
jgi:hypothetical protein